MRQLAGGLNRGWLAVIGVLLLLAGIAGALATTDGAQMHTTVGDLLPGRFDAGHMART